MKLSEAPYKLTNDGLCYVIIKMEHKPLFSRESLETQIIDSLNQDGTKSYRYRLEERLFKAFPDKRIVGKRS